MFDIKKLTKKDSSLAKDLLRAWQNDSEETEQAKKLSQSQLINRLSDDNFHVFVAIKAGLVIGGLTAYTLPLFTRAETEIFLYEIGVQESFMRQGVASTLIEALNVFCREKKISTIFLCTELENKAAQALYEKMGGEKEIVAMYTFTMKRRNQG